LNQLCKRTGTLGNELPNIGGAKKVQLVQNRFVLWLCCGYDDHIKGGSVGCVFRAVKDFLKKGIQDSEASTLLLQM
jgi:hypothetical protein